MFGSRRKLLPATLGAAVLLSGAPAAAALDQPALEELESLLRDLGFDPGPVDGVVDDGTIAAIRRYKDFALLPGAPEPSAKLLRELRGVAVAFAALNGGREQTPVAAPAPEIPALGAGTPEPPVAEAPVTESPVTEPQVPEKVIVPPPPAPPKLKPAEVETEAEAEEDDTVVEEDNQIAALPPVADASPPADTATVPALPHAPDSDDAAARIEAELAPYRADLDSGNLTREALSRQFNDEGREALQNARYDVAILKFSVAIHLAPDFAGAYSNRGTAYQRNEESELAAADFAKAKELGFGGFRMRDGKSPFK